MTSNADKAAALAGMLQQHSTRRAASIAAELAAVPAATAEHQEMKLSDLFSEQFAKPTETRHWGDRGTVSQESPWDAALRLAATDDDVPSRPAADPEPRPAVAEQLPPQETRARQLGTAEDLFQAMEQRLQPAAVEITELPADVQLRRAFRELPGGQREAIAKLIEAQDFGLPGYFDSRNFGEDYVSVLVSSALARRFADAARLQPDLSPAQLLEQISAAATASG
jgi:hypothetical protein